MQFKLERLQASLFPEEYVDVSDPDHEIPWEHLELDVHKIFNLKLRADNQYISRFVSNGLLVLKCKILEPEAGFMLCEI